MTRPVQRSNSTSLPKAIQQVIQRTKVIHSLTTDSLSTEHNSTARHRHNPLWRHITSTQTTTRLALTSHHDTLTYWRRFASLFPSEAFDSFFLRFLHTSHKLLHALFCPSIHHSLKPDHPRLSRTATRFSRTTTRLSRTH